MNRFARVTLVVSALSVTLAGCGSFDTSGFDPTEIHAYGYWGVPSTTAVTPYQRLCFAAFSIRKRNSETGAPRLQLNLPAEIRNAMALA